MKTLKIARRRIREVIVRPESLVLCETPDYSTDRLTLDNPASVAEYWNRYIGSDPLFRTGQEHLHVIMLSTRRHAIGHSLISIGLLDQVTVHAREAFRPAIMANAHAIVLVHNHPSGDPSPSEADIRVTRDMVRAGQLLKLELLDHVVMGRAGASSLRGWVSLRELGFFQV
jgi:DNA repair protein RadC